MVEVLGVMLDSDLIMAAFSAGAEESCCSELLFWYPEAFPSLLAATLAPSMVATVTPSVDTTLAEGPT